MKIYVKEIKPHIIKGVEMREFHATFGGVSHYICKPKKVIDAIESKGNESLNDWLKMGFAQQIEVILHQSPIQGERE